MNKSRGGQGTFRETKTGSVQYTVPYYDEHDVRRTKSFNGKTREDCMQRAAGFMYELDKRRIGVNEKSTLIEVLENKTEMEYSKNYIGETGYARKQEYLKTLRKYPISSMQITVIGTEDIDVFLESVTGYSNKMIRVFYKMLWAAFELAYDKRVIAINPMKADSIRCPISDKEDRKVVAMTEEDQKSYVKALMEHKVPYGRNNYKLQLLIALYTGLRMGEINALRPDHIHLDEGFIHVERTVARGINDRCYISTTKTENSVRDVPISNTVRPYIEQALAEVQKNPEGLIFYDYIKDGVISSSQVNSFQRRICSKAGIQHYCQHALRHTFATRCIEAGIEPLVLKEWLGHSNIHITLDIYADVFDRLHGRSVKKLDRMLDAAM